MQASLDFTGQQLKDAGIASVEDHSAGFPRPAEVPSPSPECDRGGISAGSEVRCDQACRLAAIGAGGGSRSGDRRLSGAE